MKFWSDSFADGGAISPNYAFCAPDAAARVKMSQNRNPHLAWSELPQGTQSVVIICHDPDVPSKADDVNKEGRTIPASLSGPLGPRATRQGINDYTTWFANDPNMKGDYFGYDGPCPPWNDSIPHHYVFALFALDMEKCPVKRKFTAAEVLKSMKGHVLGTAKITGLYSLNPAVKV
jgi:Raf kinase inhibitor-like YbhB/YbcL family protein